MLWQHRFALAVRAHMRAEVLTQRQVAAAAGIGESALNHILNGRQAASQVTMLAIAIGLDATTLIPSPTGISELLEP